MKCPSCGAEASGSETRCKSCGRPLGAATGARGPGVSKDPSKALKLCPLCMRSFPAGSANPGGVCPECASGAAGKRASAVPGASETVAPPRAPMPPSPPPPKATKPSGALIAAFVAGVVVLAAAVVVVLVIFWPKPEPQKGPDPVDAYVEAMRPVWDGSSDARRAIPSNVQASGEREKAIALIPGFESLVERAGEVAPPAGDCAKLHATFTRVLATRLDALRELEKSAVGQRIATLSFHAAIDETDREMVGFNNELRFILSDRGLQLVGGGYVR